jgi:hypothetical protein
MAIESGLGAKNVPAQLVEDGLKAVPYLRPST